MKGKYVLEVALIEVVVFLSLWLWQPYIGFLMTLIFMGICAVILLISFVAELIERSKVSRAYFVWLLVSIFIPFIVAAIFMWTSGSSVQDLM